MKEKWGGVMWVWSPVAMATARRFLIAWELERNERRRHIPLIEFDSLIELMHFCRGRNTHNDAIKMKKQTLTNKTRIRKQLRLH